jgi:hypothetical protein
MLTDYKKRLLAKPPRSSPDIDGGQAGFKGFNSREATAFAAIIE